MEKDVAGLEKLLQKARKKAKEADDALRAVYDTIDAMDIDLYVPTEAENASTLEEAINCYVQYDEYTLSALMDEIKMQL